MSSIPTTTPSTSTDSQTTTPANPSSSLGESDFLQLLVAQLQYQDPMDPTDDQSFIQEQAQFSTVEGINNMESTLTGMGTAQQMSAAVNLIGASVQYTASDGSTQSGTVSAASNTGGSVTVQVGSANVDPSCNHPGDVPDCRLDRRPVVRQWVRREWLIRRPSAALPPAGFPPLHPFGLLRAEEPPASATSSRASCKRGR